MGRLVLLRHDTPDGAHHFDLMLERVAGDERLMTFRLDRAIEPKRMGWAEAERLEEHRSAYLTYEGEVSGGRGRVSREWACKAEVGEESAGYVEVRMEGGAWIEIRRNEVGWRVEVKGEDLEQGVAEVG